MKKTEELLREAREIAWRAFQDPTQETVMELFRELCADRDRQMLDEPAGDRATLH